jgi:hypothetical protein
VIRIVHETVNDIVTPQLTAIRDEVSEKLDTALADFRAILKGHVDETFPEGPLVKHREYHENKVKAAKSAEQLKSELVGWIIKGGIAIFFVLVTTGAIEVLKRELAK